MFNGSISTWEMERPLFEWIGQILTCFAVGVIEEHVLVSEQLWRSRPLRHQTFMLSVHCESIRWYTWPGDVERLNPILQRLGCSKCLKISHLELRWITVVVVCDNAPCHFKFEECMIDEPGLTICRLGPYSPMLNPVETVCSKMKAEVKQRMHVPEVRPPGVGEQCVQYWKR